MKIALLGYGKMGKMIEKIALDRKHEIVLKIDRDNADELTAENLQKADVAIEFSTPSTVLQNIELCFKAGTPVVVGTTGWHNEMTQIQQQCGHYNASMIYGTNFSVGVNIFFHLNKMLAMIMNSYPYYEVQVEEIHHTQKLDSPSGTAITIADGIISNLDAKAQWKNVLVSDDHPNNETIATDELLIESLRIENVPGTHTVIYDSEVDTIEFKHTAHNRNGFALGAVLAAEWIKDRKGFHSIEEMFDFNKQ
ncbi:4-hydroxy-tetrahydrodipicolinate reductase [Mucilaginibacter litoreus]|uniref:4-hydroxy-tetrahydrodipicolinate reductase n=1 Tax=Mucilaginibacter litoreus TaxID=1048221 RepID=A0ABW3AVE3_9SPHI